jgi:hypothetical protein
MTLDEVCSMTLDQICDGGPYPAAEDVRHGVATGLPALIAGGAPITGTLSAATLGLSGADLRKNVVVDVVTGSYEPVAGGGSVTLSPAERNAIADAILVRGAENVEAAAGENSLCYVILALGHSDTTTHDDKLTVFKTTGDEFVQKGLTTDANAEPITGVT